MKNKFYLTLALLVLSLSCTQLAFTLPYKSDIIITGVLPPDGSTTH